MRVTLFAYERHCNGAVDLHVYTSKVAEHSGVVVGIGHASERRGMVHWPGFVKRWLRALPLVVESCCPDVVSVQQDFFFERKAAVSDERVCIERAVAQQRFVLVDYWKHAELMDDVQTWAMVEGRWDPINQ